MKIALSSSGTTLDSELDSRFGRARYFLLYDTETGELSVIDNQVNLNSAQGAGIQTAGNIADAGAMAVITGHCGPKAFRVLKEAGIKVFNVQAASVRDAVEQYKSGDLAEASGSDVESHW